MRFLEYEVSRAIRYFRLEAMEGRAERGPHLARAFEQRYEFLQGPRTVAEYDLNQGAVFVSGFFQGTTIEKVQLFHNGILVEGKASTTILDAFIDDALSWVERERGLRVLPNDNMATVQRAYASQVVVELVGPAQTPSAMAPSQQLLSLFSKAAEDHGLQPSLLAMTGLTFAPDPASGAGWFFRIERRANEPFAANKFFASAPLKTEAHLKLLEDLQRLTETSVSPPPSSRSRSASSRKDS